MEQKQIQNNQSNNDRKQNDIDNANSAYNKDNYTTNDLITYDNNSLLDTSMENKNNISINNTVNNNINNNNNNNINNNSCMSNNGSTIVSNYYSNGSNAIRGTARRRSTKVRTHYRIVLFFCFSMF